MGAGWQRWWRDAPDQGPQPGLVLADAQRWETAHLAMAGVVIQHAGGTLTMEFDTPVRVEEAVEVTVRRDAAGRLHVEDLRWK